MSLIFVGGKREKKRKEKNRGSGTSDPNKACCSCQQDASTAAIFLTHLSSLLFQEDV
jgi:hypothetical protein